jgi:hypothetical protein
MVERHDARQERAPSQPTSRRRRSHAGRIAGAAIGVAATTGIGLGLNHTGHGAAVGVACGGTERWNVKVANDADAPQVNTAPQADTIAILNGVLPGPIDGGGRMDIEKREYTISGYLAFFKQETDSDYHLVITDNVGGYSKGHSIIVEIPDPDCFSGESGKGGATSRFGQQIAEARTEFEDQTSTVDGTAISTRGIPVTVTGVAFFDFLHNQTGHSVPHKGMDGKSKVLELHPVTSIEFDKSQEQE